MQPEVRIPNEAKELMADAERTLEVVKDYQIQNAEDYASAGEQLTAIKTKAKELEGQRKAITAPLDAAKRQVMDLFRAPLQFLTDAEGVIKRSMADFQRAEEARAREEQRKAEERARKEQERLARRAEKAAEKGQADKAEELQAQSQAVQAPIAQFHKPKAQGVSIRQNWKAEVIDLTALARAVADGKVPARMIQANQQELNKLAKALQADMDVPGVRAIAEDVVSARRSA
jgi:hypothetical protein